MCAGLAALTVAGVALLFARTIVTPPKRRPEETLILAVDTDACGDGALITFNSTADSRLPGEYSLFFADGSGHARVGEIVVETSQTVIRRLLGVDSGDIFSARRGRFSGWFYTGPEDLGFPFEDVVIDTELGPAPAWLIPAELPSRRWVIEVHGRAVRREEALRAIPIFRAAGYTSLLISYRNDGEAPVSSDGRYHLGDTEWCDVESAIGYAVDHGATDVVLMGWSMGGATVLQAVTRSGLAGVVRGIVLESPVIDWISAIRFQGQLLGLPHLIRSGVIALLGMKWGGLLTGLQAPIDLPRLDFVRRFAELDLPILLMHSDDDGVIPSTASGALAAARPDIVSYERFDGAGHTKLWNFDRDRWNGAITHWLSTAPN